MKEIIPIGPRREGELTIIFKGSGVERRLTVTALVDHIGLTRVHSESGRLCGIRVEVDSPIRYKETTQGPPAHVRGADL